MSAHDTARPRAQGGFRMGEHGGAGQTGLQGNYVLRSGVAADLYSPSWSKTLTTFRPFPIPDPESPTGLSPYRRSPEDSDFGEWFVCYPYFKGGTKQITSFLLYDPVGNPDYDMHENPASILYHAIKGAIDAGQGLPSWPPLINRVAGRGAALGKPDQMYFMQGALMEHNNKLLNPPRGGGKDSKLLVLGVTGGAGRTLRGMLNERTPGYNGPVEDYDRSFLYGDPVALNSGRYIRFCEIGGALTAPTQAAPVQAAFGGSSAPSAGRGADGDDRKGYEIRIEPSFRGAGAALGGPELEAMIRGRVKPWSEVLNFPTPLEQAMLLARTFPADAIDYAFRDRPEWMTEDMLAIIRSRTAAAVPAGYPPAGYQPAGYPPAGYPPVQGLYGTPNQVPGTYGQPAAGQPQPGVYGMPNQAPAAGGQMPPQYASQPQPQQYASQPQPQQYASQPTPYVPPQTPTYTQPAPQQPAAALGWGGVAFEGAAAPDGMPQVDPALRPGMLPPQGYQQPGYPPQQQMPPASSPAGYASYPQQQQMPPQQPPFDMGAVPGAAVDPRMAALASARQAIAGQPG